MLKKYLHYLEFYYSRSKGADPFMSRYGRTLFDPLGSEWNDLTQLEKLVVLKELVRINKSLMTPIMTYKLKYHELGRSDIIKEIPRALMKHLDLLLSEDFDHQVFNELYSRSANRMGAFMTPAEDKEPVSLADAVQWMMYSLEEDVFWRLVAEDREKREELLLFYYVRENAEKHCCLVPSAERVEDDAARSYLDNLESLPSDMKVRSVRYPFHLEQHKRSVSEEYRAAREAHAEAMEAAAERQNLQEISEGMGFNEGWIPAMEDLLDIKKYPKKVLIQEIADMDSTLFLGKGIPVETGEYSVESRYIDSDVTVEDEKKEKVAALPEEEFAACF